jgi:hypothetical protein
MTRQCASIHWRSIVAVVGIATRWIAHHPTASGTHPAATGAALLSHATLREARAQRVGILGILHAAQALLHLADAILQPLFDLLLPFLKALRILLAWLPLLRWLLRKRIEREQRQCTEK